MVRSSDVDYLQDLAVDPGQTWLTVPLQWGAAAVDLTSGEVAEPVDTGCREGQGVRWVFPGHDGAALLLGECEGARRSGSSGPERPSGHASAGGSSFGRSGRPWRTACVATVAPSSSVPGTSSQMGHR